MRNVDGRLFPVSVDLADEFPAREESQTGGTCHIHTATGLFAHACYRVTGKWVDLDESYLFFLHMYEFFKVVPFDETGFKGGVSHEDYLKWRKLGPTATITGNDGGNPKDSLDRICSGNCLIAASQETGWVASEIAKFKRIGSQMYWAYVAQTYERELEAARKNKTFKEFHAKWKERFAGWLKAAGATEGADKSLTTNTPPELQECLQGRKWEIHKQPWNKELAHSLLSKGVPFSCGGNYSGVPVTGKDFSHVAIVNGYILSDLSPALTRWRLRSSDGRTVMQEKPIEGCAEMMYVGLRAAEPDIY